MGIEIWIVSTVDTSPWPVGEALLTEFCAHDESIRPDRLAHDFSARFTKGGEPFSSVEACEKLWAMQAETLTESKTGEMEHTGFFFLPFEWMRKKQLKSEGKISHFGGKHGVPRSGILRFDSAWSAKVEWFQLFLNWSKTLAPSEAYLHLNRIKKEEAAIPRRFDLWDGRRVEPKLNHVGWATYFSSELGSPAEISRMLGDDFPVDDVGPGAIVRVTENIADVQKNFEKFHERREEMIRRLPEDWFSWRD